jgi:hypothetical protein
VLLVAGALVLGGCGDDRSSGTGELDGSALTLRGGDTVLAF